MTQDLLNHLVRDAKAMKIRRQATPECMPAMPFETRLFNRRPNDISSQRFQIHRVPLALAKTKPRVGLPHSAHAYPAAF
jgi:hypothetical protein